MNAFAAALIYVWIGMVLATSFLAVPVKYTWPGIERRLGLAIDRVTYRIATLVEAVLGVLIAGTLLFAVHDAPAATACLVAVGVLLVQVTLVRPALMQHADAVMAAENAADPSLFSSFLVYNSLEVAKVVALVISGVILYRG